MDVCICVRGRRLEVSSGNGRIVVPRLARDPGGLVVREEDERLVIELLDRNGEGFATCIVDTEALSRGECPSIARMGGD